VIVARGDVHIDELYSADCRSSIFTRGSFSVETLDRAKQTSPFGAPADQLTGTEIKQNAKNALNFIRFFETTDVGVNAAKGAKGVDLQKLTSDSPLAIAGLKTGDIVLAVDGNEIGDLEGFRRQLRRAYVSQEAKVKVRRAGKELEVTVSFFGFELRKDK
jgi:S1-C subfamily serine protease